MDLFLDRCYLVGLWFDDAPPSSPLFLDPKLQRHGLISKVGAALIL